MCLGRMQHEAPFVIFVLPLICGNRALCGCAAEVAHPMSRLGNDTQGLSAQDADIGYVPLLNIKAACLPH